MTIKRIFDCLNIKRTSNAELNFEKPNNEGYISSPQIVNIAEVEYNKPARPYKKCADTFGGGKKWKREAVETLINKLKAHKMIYINTRVQSFHEVFSGKPTDKKVTWTGQKDELAYFIKRMSAEGLIEVEKHEIWLVTQKCFQLPEGECLDHRNLKTYAPPRRADKIDDMICELKRKVVNNAELTK